MLPLVDALGILSNIDLTVIYSNAHYRPRAGTDVRLVRSRSAAEPGWAANDGVFEFGLVHYPNCGGGELKIIAAILERPVIDKILEHLGLQPQPPPRKR